MSDLPSVPDLDFDITGIHDRPKGDAVKAGENSAQPTAAAEGAAPAPEEEAPPPGDVGGLADLLEPEAPEAEVPEAEVPEVEVPEPEVDVTEAVPAGEPTPEPASGPLEVSAGSSAPAEGASETKSSTTKRRRSTKPRDPDDVKTRIMDHPTDGVPKVRSRDTLADSMDEVLQQASDHALRLVHLEDMITEMHEAVATLRHEMLAKEASEDASGSSGDVEAGHRVAARLDAVEMQSMRVESKTGRLSLMAILQILLLGGVLVLLLTQGSDPAPVAQSTEAAVMEPPSTESGAGELIEPMPDRPDPVEAAKPTRKTKRKAKRRR